jgi:hypothetical protein
LGFVVQTLLTMQVLVVALQAGTFDPLDQVQLIV